jgi:hypothetical protein
MRGKSGKSWAQQQFLRLDTQASSLKGKLGKDGCHQNQSLLFITYLLAVLGLLV